MNRIDKRVQIARSVITKLNKEVQQINIKNIEKQKKQENRLRRIFISIILIFILSVTLGIFYNYKPYFGVILPFTSFTSGGPQLKINLKDVVPLKNGSFRIKLAYSRKEWFEKDHRYILQLNDKAKYYIPIEPNQILRVGEYDYEIIFEITPPYYDEDKYYSFSITLWDEDENMSNIVSTQLKSI